MSNFCNDEYAFDYCCLPRGHLGVHAGWPRIFTGDVIGSRCWEFNTRLGENDFVGWYINGDNPSWLIEAFKKRKNRQCGSVSEKL